MATSRLAFSLLASCLSLAGCASQPSAAPTASAPAAPSSTAAPAEPVPNAAATEAPFEPDSLRYATGACYGRCPVYQVTLTADGRLRFEGQQFTKKTGNHDKTVDPALFTQLRGRLAAARPARGDRKVVDSSECKLMATDHSSVEITWSRGEQQQTLTYNLGCHDEDKAAIRDALKDARKLLPIEELVGSSQ